MSKYHTSVLSDSVKSYVIEEMKAVYVCPCMRRMATGMSGRMSMWKVCVFWPPTTSWLANSSPPPPLHSRLFLTFFAEDKHECTVTFSADQPSLNCHLTLALLPPMEPSVAPTPTSTSLAPSTPARTFWPSWASSSQLCALTSLYL